jgi:hypothetical protein
MDRGLVVRHREEGNPKSLLNALCIGCELIVLAGFATGYWKPFLGMWQELHPSASLQLQFALAAKVIR